MNAGTVGKEAVRYVGTVLPRVIAVLLRGPSPIGLRPDASELPEHAHGVDLDILLVDRFRGAQVVVALPAGLKAEAAKVILQAEAYCVAVARRPAALYQEAVQMLFQGRAADVHAEL